MKETTAAKLREIGLKITPQRQAILTLLQGNRTHPSAERIYAQISKIYPGISFATVYNTLSRLAGAGEIQELDIDPNKKRFDPCLTPHYHFYCEVCREVFDIVSDIPFPAKAKRINGHRVDAIQVNFKGVCRECRRRRRDRPAPAE